MGYVIQSVPRSSTMAALLGRSIDDPTVSLALDSFGIRDRIEESEATEEAGFLHPLGLSFYFELPQKLTFGLCLTRSCQLIEYLGQGLAVRQTV